MKDDKWIKWVWIAIFLVILVAWVQDGALHRRIDKLEAKITAIEEGLEAIDTNLDLLWMATDKVIEAIGDWREVL